MQIFRNVNFKWWQVSVLKISVLVFGIVVGATWPKEFEPYLTQFLAIALVLWIYLLYVWHSQSNKSGKK